ncbi:ABC transporter permease [Paenibacillus dendritiformis]|uniref:ABC transporter permease n=1 Tax=Paenibacillus dendritiformis TaxID=130049 RepID=UPI0018CCDEEA|nr:ABC transporter permease [Paenibacillus dendritiformis]MBG9793995.1 ABC transporter permease [Paenibacillus dendritiformis]
MNFLRIIRFDFINIVRSPMLLIMNTVFPIVLFIGFGFVTSSNFGGGQVSSYDYYGVTTIIFSAIMISMTVTNTFMSKEVKKGNIRLAYAPVNKTEIYLSKLIATYIFGSLSYAIIILVEQTVFQINFGGKNMGYILLLINILTFFGCCLGTLVCCLFKSEERANAIMPILALLFVFFGGIFSPVGHYGQFLQQVANFSPVKWVTDSSFQIIYDQDFGIYLPTIAFLLFFSFICIGISQIIFKPEEYV